jgi:hypothetical protein
MKERGGTIVSRDIWSTHAMDIVTYRKSKLVRLPS